MRSALVTVPILALCGRAYAAVAPAATLVPGAVVPSGIHAPAPTPVAHGPTAAATTLPADAASLFLCFGKNGRGGCQVFDLWELNSYTCYSDNHDTGSINLGTVNVAFQSVQINPESGPGIALDYGVYVCEDINCSQCAQIPTTSDVYNLGSAWNGYFFT